MPSRCTSAAKRAKAASEGLLPAQGQLPPCSGFVENVGDTREVFCRLLGVDGVCCCALATAVVLLLLLVDKMLVLGPLLCFIEMGTVPAWPVFLIITRDLVISGWRVSGQNVTGANFWGKLKTLCQLIAVGCLLGPSQFTEALPMTGFLMVTSKTILVCLEP